MPLLLLDRDGVVVVNRKDNIKTPAGLALIPGAAEAIARLTSAGIDVAICTNQPEVARGVMSHDELDAVHDALIRMLAAKGARIGCILSCICERKTPRMKPAAGMLREALANYGARAFDTPFVGDQVDDLKAAFHAGCPRVLVRTGLGRKALEDGLPQYLEPVAVYDDLAAAVDAYLGNRGGAAAFLRHHERAS
ncbi:MAG: HAD-IIIA family hydrolase [Rhodospirillales bacterium]|nr:HAD-IIIA family hydrolase [Rhodospirillales bacterium]